MSPAQLIPFSKPSTDNDERKVEGDVVEWVRLAGPLGLTSVEIAAMDAEITGTAPGVDWFAALVGQLVATARLRDSGVVRAGRRVVVIPPAAFHLETTK